MPSYYPPKKNTEYIFYVGLASQATANTFQSNPTLASGDFKVSIDGGTLNNLATLPTVTPASSKMVKITLSASEMNGDNITVVCSDASGAEWRDLIVNLQTAARQLDDLAFPTTTGRSIDVTATGEVGIDWANIGGATTTVNLSGTTVKTATDVETDTADIQGRLPAALVSGRIDSSVGAMAANVLTAAATNADFGTEVATALLDAAVEGSITLEGVLRLLLAVMAGKSSGGGTTSINFRDTGDSKNRIAATVDSNGNRSAVTLDTSD